MVKNLPCIAGDVGMNPDWGTKSPDDAEQLSPCAATTEPVLWSLCATTRESAHHNERSHVLQLKPDSAK